MATDWRDPRDRVEVKDVQQLLAILDLWSYLRLVEKQWTASEIEIIVTNKRGDLVHGETAPIHRVMGSRKWPRIGHDFRDWMWEACPLIEDDWRSPADVRAGMIGLYEDMFNASEEYGVLLLPVADPSCFRSLYPTKDVRLETQRYQWLVDALPGIRVGAMRTGFQTHVASTTPLDDRYFAARIGMEQMVPLLIAAGASSYHPYEMVMSKRYFNFKALTSCGFRAWDTRELFERSLVDRWEDGLIKGPHDDHAWVKPCRRSTEMRPLDTPQSVEHAITLHGVNHAVVEYNLQLASSERDLFRMDRTGETRRREHAANQAAQWGTTRLDFEMFSPFQEGSERMDVLYQKLDDAIGPVMTDLGYGHERDYFFNEMVANRQNGAEHQRRWREEEGLKGKEFLLRSNRFLKDSLVDARQRFLPGAQGVLPFGRTAEVA